jgi:hypothetical protein
MTIKDGKGYIDFLQKRQHRAFPRQSVDMCRRKVARRVGLEGLIL